MKSAFVSVSLLVICFITVLLILFLIPVTSQLQIGADSFKIQAPALYTYHTALTYIVAGGLFVLITLNYFKLKRKLPGDFQLTQIGHTYLTRQILEVVPWMTLCGLIPRSAVLYNNLLLYFLVALIIYFLLNSAMINFIKPVVLSIDGDNMISNKFLRQKRRLIQDIYAINRKKGEIEIHFNEGLQNIIILETDFDAAALRQFIKVIQTNPAFVGQSDFDLTDIIKA